jgi:hypothetical protein
MSDQKRLHSALKEDFPNRTDLLQIRVGVAETADETSFRSRSLIFLALGIYTTELLGSKVPLIIPENGPIALNFPLSASRRGSCSTRTVHPRFIRDLGDILMEVGLNHSIINPYAFKTKGEMVKECRIPHLLKENFEKSVSCAKSGHTVHWHNRRAGACGRCVPCLFRRAALFVGGMDTQEYGFDVLAPHFNRDDFGDDFPAILALLNRNPTDQVIAQELIANGPVPIKMLPDFISVVKRMIEEVRSWISAGASQRIKDLAGIK